MNKLKMVFQFTYTVFQVNATIEDDVIHAQMGIKQVHVHLQRLQHLYVDERKDTDSCELILSYVTAKGALKRTRIFADRGEPGFLRLIEAILARRPEIDIRELPPEEAYVRMGSTPAGWFVLPLIMFLGMFIVGVFCTPMLIHGLDTEIQELSIDQVGGESDGRSLSIGGGVLRQDFSVTNLTPDQARPNAKVWIPLVSADWTESDDVMAVVEIFADDLTSLESAPRVRGLLRNVWWEGLDSKVASQMRQRGVRLTSDVWLIDANSTSWDELALIGLIFGCLIPIFLIVSWKLYQGRARRS